MAVETKNAGAMPAFTDFAKLGTSLALTVEQFETGHTMHAYLLTGAKGIGKMTFARYLAMIAYCEGARKPCGVCDACKRVLSGNDPDLIEITSQDGKLIPIDRVRDTLDRIAQHSFGSGPRVVLIEPIERLTPQAQNCLLKSLEEPSTDVIFLLMAHETSALLGTIASRCSRVKLTPWSDEFLAQTLQKLGYTPTDDVLSRASGNIGLALSMLRDHEKQQALSEIVQAALNVRADADVVRLSTQWKDDKDGAELALTAIEQAIHHALLVRTGRLSAPPSADEWQASACHAPVQDLTELLQTVFDTRKKRQSQVNWQTGVDHLLMKLLEANTRWQRL